MKTRITGKQLKDNFTVAKMGYCEAQTILRFHEPLYYNAGVYGWNYDVYIFGHVAIVTGYRPINGIRLDVDKVRALEKEAEKINSWDSGLTYEEQKTETEKLLHALLELIKEV